MRLLSGFLLHRGDAVLPVPRPSARVVAILALRGQLEREAVASALWPDTAPTRAQGYLRTALWRLNSATAGLVTTTGCLLELGEGVEVDACRLRDWAMSIISGVDGVDGVADLPHTEHIGRELLPSWDDPWLDEHREQLRVLVPEALEALALTRLDGGSAAGSLWYALRALQLDPLRESAVRILVEIHLRQGNRGAAVRTASQYRRLLRSELGVDPTPALLRLIENHAPAAATARPSRETVREPTAGPAVMAPTRPARAGAATPAGGPRHTRQQTSG